MAAPADDITLGEVYRLVQSLDARNTGQFLELNDRLTRGVVGVDYYRAAHGALEARVTEIQRTLDRRESFVRNLVIGTFVSTLGTIGAVGAAIVANLRVH